MTADHLLEPAELAELGPSITRDLPLGLVDPNPLNPRKTLSEIDTLAENIKKFSMPGNAGLMQPVLVRRNGERFELLGGHRRLAAFKLLQEREPFDARWQAIPAVVWSVDDAQAEVALISNQTQIVTWKPKEQAKALEHLVLSGLSVLEVAQVLGRTKSWASKRLKVYSDSVLSGYVQSEKIPPSVAEELLGVLDPAVKAELAERAAAEGWGQDHARSQVRALRLDRQLSAVARRAHELYELLSTVDLGRLPPEARTELVILAHRIRLLAKGGKPALPTIEQAMRAAGVKTQDKPRSAGRPRKAGYRPKI